MKERLREGRGGGKGPAKEDKEGGREGKKSDQNLPCRSPNLHLNPDHVCTLQPND